MENGYLLLEKRIKGLLRGAQAGITREETARTDGKERFENITSFFGR